MIFPSTGWNKRPGILIPVFFLSLLHGPVTGQNLWPGAASAALGGARVCLQEYWCSSQNQAGLGFIETSSLSLQHSMPYLLEELGISSLSAQFSTSAGALGISFSTLGLKGFRQSSLWLSYGLKLHARLSAGLGIHFWYASVPDQFFEAPGISFALGLLLQINDEWMLGTRLLHPASWHSGTELSKLSQGTVETGFSYTFFGIARILAEFHYNTVSQLQLMSGMEWRLNRAVLLRIGFCDRPSTFTGGVGLQFSRWIADISFQFGIAYGLSPFTSLTHAW
jgi:hypothetical protein